jgi:hypothetical protein
MVLLFERGILGPPSEEDQCHRLGGGLAALDKPFVILLAQEGAGEPDHGCVVGEDPDDVGATADLLVDALGRIRRVELGPVL